MSKPAHVSVVETPEFLAATRRIMGEEERGLLINDFRCLTALLVESYAKRSKR